MFCKNCGNKIPENNNFCPVCGIRVTVKNKNKNKDLKKQNIQNIIKIIIVSAVFLIFIVWGIKMIDKSQQNCEMILQDNSAELIDKTEVKETDDTLSIIGVWSCEQGEVIFTENGHLMVGKNGILLGGGWIDYEVVDDSTLYVSGGNIPIGMSIKYSLTDEYLILELATGNLNMRKTTKEK